MFFNVRIRKHYCGVGKKVVLLQSENNKKYYSMQNINQQTIVNGNNLPCCRHEKKDSLFWAEGRIVWARTTHRLGQNIASCRPKICVGFQPTCCRAEKDYVFEPKPLVVQGKTIGRSGQNYWSCEPKIIVFWPEISVPFCGEEGCAGVQGYAGGWLEVYNNKCMSIYL